MSDLTVKQVRSSIGSKPNHRGTLRALGLGRIGSKVPGWYEGGQLPLQRRLPKMKGFTNPFRVEYHPINLDTLDETGLNEIDPDLLLERGLVSKGAMVKILGRGEISRAVNVKAHAVSQSAEAAITAAGGTVEILPPTFKGPRPPARGNQHTNR